METLLQVKARDASFPVLAYLSKALAVIPHHFQNIFVLNSNRPWASP
jgi:hypothetical protein